MTEAKDITLDRKLIRKLFHQHRGAASALAEKLNVYPSAVSQWLRGRLPSAKIKAAAEAQARAWLAQGRKRAA
jgi:DNA-binding transcriptional regulator YdaS (Cro superfamily)